MKNKKGISLVVLVITIIVMIILASTIILTLSNSGIINKSNEAVEKSNLIQVKKIAALKWAEAYTNENIKTNEAYKAYIENGLKESGINPTDYIIIATEKGVEVRDKFSSEWTENVAAIVDTVPVPKGFVASPYDGENTKAGGLVIYELAEGETAIPSDETQYTSWTTRNQYVWIPVDDFSNFVTGSYDNTSYSNVLGTDTWEVELDLNTNMPLLQQNTDYVTDSTLTEVQSMYASVKEYGGFYIARYEAGIDQERTSKGTSASLLRGINVYSRMNKIPYTYIPWTWNNAINEDANGAVEVARSIYPNTNDNTTGVISTLIYGVQWDAVLNWWLAVEAKDINGNKINLNNSVSYGNYSTHIIKAGDLNEGAKYAELDFFTDELTSYELAYNNSSPSEDMVALSTGALKAAKVNNIYDMAGNMSEWTMEGYSSTNRVIRGSAFNLDFNSAKFFVVDGRTAVAVNSANMAIGFRATLYIKK